MVINIGHTIWQGNQENIIELRVVPAFQRKHLFFQWVGTWIFVP